LAFLSLLLYLFVLHSRVLDLTLPFLHIPILSLYAAVTAAFLGGGFFRAFTNRIGVLLLLFSFWMVLSVPFSVWPGGAAQGVKDWSKALLVYVVIAGLVTTFDQFRRTVHLLAFSILVLALMAIVFGDMSGGRLVLSRGRFTNPNDLAQILLMGLPFWWYIATNPKVKRSRKLLAFGAMVPIFMAMSKTGSRGAFIASVVVALVLFWRSSVSHKVLLMFGAVTLVVLAAAFLPQETKNRYFTIFKGDEEEPPETQLQYAIESSAVSSTWSRWFLLQDSIKLTFLHPVFGVGTNQFDVAQDLYSRQTRNQKGAWQVTHNTFTQVSSENGFPALLFYSLALFYAFRFAKVPKTPRPRSSPKPAKRDELTSASFCLRLSLLSLLVSSMFGSFAYQTQFLVLAGLAFAFSRTSVQEMAGAGQPAPPAEERRMVRGRRPATALSRTPAGARA
jgi:hypothetical protein